MNKKIYVQCQKKVYIKISNIPAQEDLWRCAFYSIQGQKL